MKKVQKLVFLDNWIMSDFFFRDIACTSSIVSKINLQENLINKSCSIKIYCKDLGPTLRSLLTKKLPTNILENCLVSWVTLNFLCYIQTDFFGFMRKDTFSCHWNHFIILSISLYAYYIYVQCTNIVNALIFTLRFVYW